MKYSLSSLRNLKDQIRQHLHACFSIWNSVEQNKSEKEGKKPKTCAYHE